MSIIVPDRYLREASAVKPIEADSLCGDSGLLRSTDLSTSTGVVRLLERTFPGMD